MLRWTLATLFLLGCSSNSSAAPAGGKGYAIQVSAPATAKVSAATTVKVVVTPAAGYHVNKEFPTVLEVTPPPGVDLAKAKLTGKDATRLEESGIEMAVTFTPTTAGSKEFKAVLKFAVCTADSCLPRRESLAWTVNVK